MKKLKLALSGCLTAASALLLVLIHDTAEFYSRLRVPDGEGTALHLLGGLWEVADRITWEEAPAYMADCFFLLRTVAAVVVGLSAILLAVHLCSGRKKNEKD